MKLLLELIAITSILVLGYSFASQNGMVLFFIRDWAEKKYEKGTKWVNPVLLCVVCQSSSWSLIAYGLSVGMGLINSFSWSLIFMYPLVVCGSCIINSLVWSWYVNQDAKIE